MYTNYANLYLQIKGVYGFKNAAPYSLAFYKKWGISLRII